MKIIIYELSHILDAKNAVFRYIFLPLAVYHFSAPPPPPQTHTPKGLISKTTHLRENGFYACRPKGREPAGALGGQGSAHSHGGCGEQTEARG